MYFFLLFDDKKKCIAFQSLYISLKNWFFFFSITNIVFVISSLSSCIHKAWKWNSEICNLWRKCQVLSPEEDPVGWTLHAVNVKQEKEVTTQTRNPRSLSKHQACEICQYSSVCSEIKAARVVCSSQYLCKCARIESLSFTCAGYELDSLDCWSMTLTGESIQCALLKDFTFFCLNLRCWNETKETEALQERLHTSRQTCFCFNRAGLHNAH